MSPQFDRKVLGRTDPDKFVGRTDEMERIYLRAVSGAENKLVWVAGKPGAGTSETLRQVYDRLFREQRFTLPFYFALRASDLNSRRAAARFAYEFLLQAIAFRRRESGLIAASPDICELQKLAPVADLAWINAACETCESDSPLNDDAAFIRSAIAMPYRASANNRFRVCLIVDDLHNADLLDDGSAFVQSLLELEHSRSASVIVGSRRGARLPAPVSEVIRIERLNEGDAARIFAAHAAALGVPLSDAVRDILLLALDASPEMIRSVVFAASESQIGLETYRDAARVYASELTEGRIGEQFRRLIEDAAVEPSAANELAAALRSAAAGRDPFRLSDLRSRLGISQQRFDRMVRVLSAAEVIEIGGGSGRFTGTPAFADHLEYRHQVDFVGVSESVASASTTLDFLKRSSKTMSREYRRKAAAGLRDILIGFDLQEVPRALLDYRTFRDRYKGLEDPEVRSALAEDPDRIALPLISHVATLADYIPLLGSEIDRERAVVGRGFTGRSYRDEDEVAWIAAEIDSKLEADPELTLEWCGVIGSAAEQIGLENYRIWLIAPEGFSPGALDILSERGGIGTSRRQLELLREYLNAGRTVENAGKDYELVIPAGDDSEIIAAHALDEIARRYNYPAKALNQAKTALVEACINAAEHGLSPDGKIYQKFSFFPEQLIVTVSNRGIRLGDKLREVPETEIDAGETRRGWGLKLIRQLMDDVRVEAVDDGTRIVMTKKMA